MTSPSNSHGRTSAVKGQLHTGHASARSRYNILGCVCEAVQRSTSWSIDEDLPLLCEPENVPDEASHLTREAAGTVTKSDGFAGMHSELGRTSLQGLLVFALKGVGDVENVSVALTDPM